MYIRLIEVGGSSLTEWYLLMGWCPELNEDERVCSSRCCCLFPNCRCNITSCLMLQLLGEEVLPTQESPSDRCFMGPAEYVAGTRHRHKCFGVESPSILFNRHKLLTRSSHSSSWPSSDEGERFYFLDDILSQMKWLLHHFYCLSPLTMRWPYKKNECSHWKGIRGVCVCVHAYVCMYLGVYEKGERGQFAAVCESIFQGSNSCF